MLITNISLRNFMGAREAKYDLGRVTEIVGPNSAGKSTLIAALQNALGGGDLAKLRNVDSDEEPELGLSIDGGEFLVQRKGKDTTVMQRVGNSAAYEKVRRPQTFIDAWYDAMLSDPMRLYRAAPKEQVDILLEILAQDLRAEQIREAVGDELWPSIKAPVTAGGHPLQVLANVRQALFDERTGVNRSKLDKERTAQTVRTSIPADMPEASAEAIGTMERERDELAATVRDTKARAEHAAGEVVTKATADYDTLKAKVEGDFKAKAANIRRAADQAIADATAEAERKIAAIREELAQAVAKYKAAADTDVDNARAAGERTLDEAGEALEQARQQAAAERTATLSQISGAEARLGELIAKLERARTEAEQYTKLQALKEEADRHEADAKSLAGRADRLTAGIDAVDGLKASLLSAIPIPGLECDGKTIKLNKVPLEQVNTTGRVIFAANVAALRAQRHPLKLVFVDNAECLDSEHRALLLKTLEERGVQIVVARVDDGPFRVEARAHAAATA